MLNSSEWGILKLLECSSSMLEQGFVPEARGRRDGIHAIWLDGKGLD